MTNRPFLAHFGSSGFTAVPGRARAKTRSNGNGLPASTSIAVTGWGLSPLIGYLCSPVTTGIGALTPSVVMARDPARRCAAPERAGC